MCRYAQKRYKIHFACFTCRKAYKKPPVEDLAIQHGDWEDYKNAFWNSTSGQTKRWRKQHPEKFAYLSQRYQNRSEKCPECGNLMADLGLDFKAPKQHNVKAWRVIQSLYKSGKTFYSCGCTGFGHVPSSLKDHISYLQQHSSRYVELLAKRDSVSSIAELSDYLHRLQELIQLIDTELANLGASS